jgi:hypothetical protein
MTYSPVSSTVPPPGTAADHTVYRHLFVATVDHGVRDDRAAARSRTATRRRTDAILLDLSAWNSSVKVVRWSSEMDGLGIGTYNGR